jgi:ABC-type transport system substrate-binding protein
MKAGIAVDNWKLPVFRKRLEEAGYEYTDGGPLTGDTTILTVETSNMLALKTVLEECQAECRRIP